MWDLEGKELECWKGHRISRIADLGITSDGKHIVSICKDNMILLFGVESKAEQITQEDQTKPAFVLSADNRYKSLDQEIHLWSIEGSVKLIAKYKGHKRSRSVVRSCFDGQIKLSLPVRVRIHRSDREVRLKLASEFLRCSTVKPG
ncbi:hypothetical protein RND71_034792 [Anisodus tanguticus]|uniref:Uncharacterized protein n=1 Tax=Anisodus tanguticus TaxID=243964 RepID=A0AAE1R485_9SOLA|nr:hypothetical protein RND71_034792 [Anisodus tanguticus]